MERVAGMSWLEGASKGKAWNEGRVYGYGMSQH